MTGATFNLVGGGGAHMQLFMVPYHTWYRMMALYSSIETIIKLDDSLTLMHTFSAEVPARNMLLLSQK